MFLFLPFGIWTLKKLQAIFRTPLIVEEMEYKDIETMSDLYSVEYQVLVSQIF